MKRITLVLLALVTMISLISCGKEKVKVEEKTYVSEGTPQNTLTIAGDRVTFVTASTNEYNFDNGKKATRTQVNTMSGFITKDEDGTYTVNLDKKGATVTFTWSYEGDGAEEARAKDRDLALTRDDVTKQMMLELIEGKSVKMNHGDKRWSKVGPMFLKASVTVDDEKGTFTLTPLFS